MIFPFKQGRRFANKESDFFENTLLGQGSNLARQIKLQMLGVIWSGTDADKNISSQENLPKRKIDDSPRYHGMQPPEDLTDALLFSALAAGQDMVKPVPVLIVNEPIFIAKEASGTVSYNVPYPRWAYDRYREAINGQAQNAQWYYLDLWNAVPPEHFADAGLHLSATGERILIEQINPTLQSIGCY